MHGFHGLLSLVTTPNAPRLRSSQFISIEGKPRAPFGAQIDTRAQAQ